MNKLIRRGDVYNLFHSNGTASLHVADIDRIPVIDTLELPCMRAYTGMTGTCYDVLWWDEQYGFMLESFVDEGMAKDRLSELY